MAFQSLYRRYRPQRFSEIKGQEHVVRALRNAAAEDRLGHAYLFSGPRGTGKTSTARILAKVLNCEHPVDGEPDGTCASCLAIEAGTSFDVTELDAASNTGVDNMRDLIASTTLASPGRTRLYILDEVHMLSKGAAAALLKTLEEPPAHVVFVLATTDPEKVLPTIRSRTQHLEFRLLPAAELEEHVRWVIRDAGLDVDEEGIAQAIREGRGSARDTLSALDRIVAAGGVARSDESVGALLDAIAERDTGAVLVAVADAAAQGRDPRVVGEQVLDHLRNAFLVAMGADVAHLSEADRQDAVARAEQLRPAAITRALEALGTALVDMRQAPDPRIPLEVALVRITRPESDTSVEALLERIEALERALRGGAAPEPAAVGRSPVAEVRSRLAEAKAAPPVATPAPVPAPEPDPPSPVTVPAAEAPPADLPTRDELTLAWGDRVLDGLRPKHKALFAVGRFLDPEDGRAVMALPNAPHVGRADPYRADVEAALAADFGRPVPLTLVVDPGSTAPTPPPAATARSAEDRGEDDPADIGPVDELEDAGDADGGLDRVKEVFGDVQLVEEDRG